MRKICNILLMFCVFVPNLKFDVVDVASADSTMYAKVLNGCNLYKTRDMETNGFNDVYFEVPETYFVTILEMVNENCYKVQYDRFIGYINPSMIQVSTFIPTNKTLEGITCDIKTTSGTQIWSAPTTSADVLTTISAGTKGINYIASCYGGVPSGGECDLWYYVSYVPSENSTNVYEGYIYSENVSNISPIPANLETNPEQIISAENLENNSLLISSTVKTIIVAIVSIPIILFFVIILYKIVKIFRKNTNKNNFDKGVIETENFKYDERNKVDIGKFKKIQFTKINKEIKPASHFPTYDIEDDLL